MNDVTTERWLPIPGYEGLYDVSDHGRVRSWKIWGHAVGISAEPRILRQSNGPGGYQLVTVHKWTVPVSRTVHSLVMEAFVGPRPPGMQIAHNDGDRKKNHLSNLRYDTPAGNTSDRVAHGTQAQGERHGCHKLTEAQVLEIRARYDSGGHCGHMAQEYGVHPDTISRVGLRKHWAWLPDKI